MSTIFSETEIACEALSTLSPEELDLLLDEDETKLEEREAALAEIRMYVIEEGLDLNARRQRYELMRTRYDAIASNVKHLRRRRERINFRFPDGTRIYDLEVVEG